MGAVIKPKDPLLPWQRPKPNFSHLCQLCVSFLSAICPDKILRDLRGISALRNPVCFLAEP